MELLLSRCSDDVFHLSDFFECDEHLMSMSEDTTFQFQKGQVRQVMFVILFFFPQIMMIAY